MEKWSAIHNTFKFFKLGRPPRMEKIEKSPEIQSVIKLMHVVKNKCKKNLIAPPLFKANSWRVIENKLNNFENKINE
jgi:hypothetical protein